MNGTNDNNNPQKREITNMYLGLSSKLVGSIDEIFIILEL
jgi:hypothetical protein